MSDMTISLSVNGADRDLAAGTTIADLVADVAGDDRGVAVAVDGVVLPRDKWDATVGDLGASAVDILNAVQGG
ncbi:sulfur carrier protein ThiS [uncultured Corynebacterium sp.]|uniref:sulfur carrier protein ThiS n=1 Tax=uncultured Corynebacterium sp. TaxID=159447 RepID=UPI00260B07AF|nr:sulfur carrier protein ThiS [uncultured Corynebacterium sp.]